MIRLDRLLDAATGDGHLSFDREGASASWPHSPSEPAVIFVDVVTDAVKTLSGDVIQGALDRDQVWAVVGFKVGREVAAAVSHNPMTAESLIDAVREAGFEWTAVEVPAS